LRCTIGQKWINLAAKFERFNIFFCYESFVAHDISNVGNSLISKKNKDVKKFKFLLKNSDFLKQKSQDTF
jgi:hypothetical protein